MPYIHTIGVSAPSFRADNQYLKDMVMCNSAPFWVGRASELSSYIDEFFRASGCDKRLIRKDNSPPKHHIAEAVRRCLANAPALNSGQISSLIYCGIDRGIYEPATASVIAHQVELDDVRAFDVSDACLGWITSCQAATAFASADKPLSIVVSAEFPWERDGVVDPGSLTIRSEAELPWKLSALTLGEAATATLIDASRGIGTIKSISENQHHELCIVPAREPMRFLDWNEDPGLINDSCFVAHGPSGLNETNGPVCVSLWHAHRKSFDRRPGRSPPA